MLMTQNVFAGPWILNTFKLQADRRHAMAGNRWTTLGMVWALAFVATCTTSFGLLGETEDECIARYGAPIHREGEVIAFKNNKRLLEITFRAGKAALITCRDSPISAPVLKISSLPSFREIEVLSLPSASSESQEPWSITNAPLKILSLLWGEPEPSALYLGMWSTHLTNPDLDIANNWLIGINYKGYFVGTFINSYDKRSWAAGIERRLFSAGEKRSLNASLGYRLGLLTGYEERFTMFFGHSPIIVFPELYTNIAYKNLGVQIGYSWTVVTGGFFIRF